MRNHLQHFDERLPGRRRAAVLKKRYDLGNVSGDVFSFGGEQIAIGWQSFRQLEKILAEVEGALKREAWDRIIATDSKLAEHLMFGAWR
jgi:hypothetical protein